MFLPTINQYITSISNPRGLTRTLGAFEPERDNYGSVRFFAGNNSVIFPVTIYGRKTTLKCHIKPGHPSTGIYDYLSANPDGLYSMSRICRRELYVFDPEGDGAYFDVVVSEWVEGNTLTTEIKRAVKEEGAGKLRELSVAFDIFSCEILERTWAHGDIKPDNIIVRRDGSFVLVDYDAMFIPGVSGNGGTETGTPGFRHPLREIMTPCKAIDDYPIAIISTCLRALAYDPDLYFRYGASDILIFDPDEIIENRSRAFDEVLEIFAKNGDHDSYALASLLKSPNPVLPDLSKYLKREASTTISIPVLYEENGRWGYRYPDGENITAAVFEEATGFSEGFACVRLNGVVQFIDISGRSVLPGRYENIKPFSEGFAAVCSDGRWGYIDEDFKEWIPCIFENARAFHEGVAPVKVPGGKWGFIDRSGTLVLDPLYDNVTAFRCGRSTVYSDNEAREIHLAQIMNSTE